MGDALSKSQKKRLKKKATAERKKIEAEANGGEGKLILHELLKKRSLHLINIRARFKLAFWTYLDLIWYIEANKVIFCRLCCTGGRRSSISSWIAGL